MYTRMLVNGQLVTGQEMCTSVINPATGTALVQIAGASDEQVKLAAAAAGEAFDAYRYSSLNSRISLLHELAFTIERNAIELAELESLDTGKPVSESLGHDLPRAIDAFRLCAAVLRTRDQGVVSEEGAAHTAMICRDALGPIALTAQWNYPILSMAHGLAAALATGCSAVLKPSELSPLGPLRLAQLMQEDVPPGLINTVYGRDQDIGRQLAEMVRQRRLACIDSPAVAADAYYTKAPVIVYADADLQLLIDTLIQNAFSNAGQDAALPGQLWVEESIFAEVVDRLAFKAVAIRTGAPDDDYAQMGPLISEVNRQALVSWVNEAKQYAELATGGFSEDGPGFFFRPTVIANPNADLRVDGAAVFGPIISVSPFKAGQDPVALANNLAPAVAVSVWTRDIHRAIRESRRLRHACTWINTHGNSWAAGRTPEMNQASTLVSRYTRERHLLFAH